ncbi:MAG TPA: redox-sensing transcriptional repressor Rex [Treponemataceae bacterium]|nr:redox-sensing transcriptional repressor Rex [Treponemataceae bacterium]
MAIPKPTAERLSQLARLLSQRGKTSPISSAEIEQMTGWTSNTIRKDISSLEAGSEIATSTGYDPQLLSQAIRESLNLTASATKCCIVGLGRLGSAFLEYSGFHDSPFSLCAGFDSNVNRVEILKADFPLYPTFKMKDVIPRMGITFAILSVPPGQAQETTDRLIDCGIIGIANFTPAIISVPSGIEVENISILDALGSISARLAAKNQSSLRSEQ